MALSLGRKKEATDADPLGPVKGVGKRLLSAGEKGYTGALQVTVLHANATARLYLYEGGLYAVHLDGYAPRLMDRMLASGGLDGARWGELASIYGAHRADPRVGVAVVEQDWISIDDLVSMHQEFLIASLGAVTAHAKVKVDQEDGASTSEYCSLPQDVTRVLRLVNVRTQRMSNAWQSMGATGTAAELVLYSTGNPLPESLQTPDFVAMAAAVDGVRSLDAVAEQLGLTRAEAVRLASLLVLADTVRIDRDRTGEVPKDRLLVPEAFGVSLRHDVYPEPVLAPPPPPPVAATPVVAPVPPPPPPAPVVAPPPPPAPVVASPPPAAPVVASPPPAAPVAAPPPPAAPVAAPPPPAAPSPPPAAAPAAVAAEPRPAAEHAPFAGAPEPARLAEALPDDPGSAHVRQLRLEVALGEASELAELLQEAVAAEHEALTRTAVIRQRLRETLELISRLSDGTLSPAEGARPADSADAPGGNR